jgi:hypothetical protein
LTKQAEKLNIVLVSSEHGFPFRLEDQRLWFNTNNINKYISAGEVAPNDMFKLLTEEWGIKNHLALALMSHFGGHIHYSFLAVNGLVNWKFKNISIGAKFREDVSKCIHACKDDKEMKSKMIKTLQTLAVKGFCGIDDPSTNPIAEIISSKNVGGVIRKTSLETVNIGVPDDVWESYKYGIIPANQSMRLAIVEALAILPRDWFTFFSEFWK